VRESMHRTNFGEYLGKTKKIVIEKISLSEGLINLTVICIVLFAIPLKFFAKPVMFL
jgi:hypothetical protein